MVLINGNLNRAESKPDLEHTTIQTKNVVASINRGKQPYVTPTPTPESKLIAAGAPPTNTPTAIYNHAPTPTNDEWDVISVWFPNINKWETNICSRYSI